MRTHLLHMLKLKLIIATLFAGVSSPLLSQQTNIHIAVASNFQTTLKQLTTRYQQQHNDQKILISSGSTGILYAQIMQGAPYDILLAADLERPLRLEAANRIIPDTRQTYAIGQLAFWQPTATSAVDAQTLRWQNFKRLAIANPNTAPYGLAARQVLEYFGLPRDKYDFIQGENIAQTFQFIQSGNVEAGFVALSLLIQAHTPREQYWLIPVDSYSAIEQQAVLINDTPAARVFLQFLHSDIARRIIVEAGYRHKD